MTVNQEILEAACERLGVRMLVLFGSRVPGGLLPRPESDVDIALSFRPDVPRPSWFDVYEQLTPAFPDAALDLVSLETADPLFRWEIMDRAALLHGDIDEFLEYRAFAYRDFVDSADLRALERTLFEKKMARIRERLGAAS
jgi:predicted nucleotidyltransferase